jgi:hypothetical protein
MMDSGRKFNGRAMTSFYGESIKCSPDEKLVWALLSLAAEDVGHLARHRIIDRNGWCAPWPIETSIGSDGYLRTEAVKIVGMRHTDAATQLKHFWLNGAAQEWGDLVGLRIPAKEVFYKTLKTHAPE